MRSFTLSALAVLLATPQVTAQHEHHAGGHAAAEAPPADQPLSPALVQQLDALRAATARFSDIEVARAEGYRRFGRAEAPLMGEHWYREDLVDQPLDLTRPSTLQYAVIDGKRMLVGVAYTIYQRPGEPLPAGFDGDLDRWHAHDVMRMARTAVAKRPLLRWLVERRIDQGKVGLPGGRTQLVMVHAWPFLENPDGPFAETHRALPYLRAGLPAEWAQGASEAAAWGVSLLEDGGCVGEVQRVDFLAAADRDQKRTIRAACDRAATRVRAADRSSAAALNGVAERSWREFEGIRDAALTAEQRELMASAVEHPGM